MSLVGVGALVLGGLTSFGQSLLPAPVSSVANSASGWTAVVVLLIWAGGLRPMVTAAASGVLGFAALNLGYQIVSNLRGFFSTGEFWFARAAVVGPIVGVAAVWLHEHGWRAALGVALISGVGLGEGVQGLLFLPTTSPVYWTLTVVVALLLLTVVCIGRLSTIRARSAAISGTLTVAGFHCAAISILL